MVKNDETKSCKCPYCDHFEGMHTTKECCEYAKKFHIREVTEWLQHGPDGKPRLKNYGEHNMRMQGEDPICWAAGHIMCTQ